MNKKIIEGDISIIPSKPEYKLKEMRARWTGDSKVYLVDKFKNLIEDIIGRKIDESELFFEVIVSSPGYPNWYAQRWPGKETSFPKYLPEKELGKLKEGKTLPLTSKFGVIKLTAKQQGNKPFHEVYNDLLKVEE